MTLDFFLANVPYIYIAIILVTSLGAGLYRYFINCRTDPPKSVVVAVFKGFINNQR